MFPEDALSLHLTCFKDEERLFSLVQCNYIGWKSEICVYGKGSRNIMETISSMGGNI